MIIYSGYDSDTQLSQLVQNIFNLVNFTTQEGFKIKKENNYRMEFFVNGFTGSI